MHQSRSLLTCTHKLHIWNYVKVNLVSTRCHLDKQKQTRSVHPFQILYRYLYLYRTAHGQLTITLPESTLLLNITDFSLVIAQFMFSHYKKTHGYSLSLQSLADSLIRVISELLIFVLSCLTLVLSFDCSLVFTFDSVYTVDYCVWTSSVTYWFLDCGRLETGNLLYMDSHTSHPVHYKHVICSFRTTYTYSMTSVMQTNNLIFFCQNVPDSLMRLHINLQ